MTDPLPPCPEPPEFPVDWEALDRKYPWVHNLRGCPQDPVRHAEGDVWAHVRMVCEAMAAMPAWRDRPALERRRLFAAALLHDVAKPACTRVEPDGRLRSRGHSWRGAIMTRRILWRMGAPFGVREHIAALVRHHLVPLYVQERELPQRLAIEMSQTAVGDDLGVLAEADARGRICPDPERLLASVAFFRRVCEENNCLYGPYEFPSEHARFLYFRHPGRVPNAPAEIDYRCEATLLVGLPGAGKDHWAKQHLADRPMISLDAIRMELGMSPTEPQGPVLAKARLRAQEYLRARQSFVWNAPNLSRNVRQECIRLFADYDARVRIVYREVPPERLFAQNRRRRELVPEKVIERLLDRWEVPDRTEAHQVDYIVDER